MKILNEDMMAEETAVKACRYTPQGVPTPPEADLWGDGVNA